MAHATRNSPRIAGADGFLLVADRENGPPFQHHTDLFVGVRMLLDNRARLEVHQGQHHILRGASAKVDAGKDRVTAAFVGGGEVLAHALT